MADALRDTDREALDWEDILLSIKYGKCTPFLGAGACVPTLPVGSQIAGEWARRFEYPLEDTDDLPRVAQFVAVKHGPMRPKYEIARRFGKVKPPDFKAPDEPHAVLAMLPLPVYITTNYDDFMVKALQSCNKDPVQELCRWNGVLQARPSVFGKESQFDPTNQRPVVFHLHGRAQMPESLVLTEDDYLDFLVNTSKDQDQDIIPARIARAFRETSLLFLGYKLADWDFRVLFRSLVAYMDKSVSNVHLSVQLVPVDAKASLGERTRVRDYLDRYFGEHKIKVYWGTCREFVTELRRNWEAFDHGG
ncbi:MAG: hypothetical protein A2Y77_01850 [Planctomycetes bacterium RBG_13_62_9]|nr:MAG: hypothetical protein A2Y77_01850 [Planctomycetes bacterium RBG_13_62_9]